MQTDIIKKVEELLRRDGAYGGTFFDIGEHAPIAGIRAGVEAFRNAGADHIVSVGGGSPVDASKAILFMLRKDAGGTGELLRQIAVPTTLSAAEYTVRLSYCRPCSQTDASSDWCRLHQ